MRGVAGLLGDPAVDQSSTSASRPVSTDPGTRDPSPGSAAAVRCCRHRGRSRGPPRSPPSAGPPLLGAHRRAVHDPVQGGRRRGRQGRAPADHGTAHRIPPPAPACPGSPGSPRPRRRVPAPGGCGPSGVATELMKIGITGTAAASPNSVCSGCTVPWSTSMPAEIATSTPASRTAVAQSVGDVGRDVERPRLGAVVADAGRGGADAERRHQPVEEPVVVVRGEDDDQFGVEVGDELPRLGERGRRCRQAVPATVPEDSAAGCGTCSTEPVAPWDSPPSTSVRESGPARRTAGAAARVRAGRCRRAAMQRSGRRNSTDSAVPSNQVLSAPVRSPTTVTSGSSVARPRRPVQLGQRPHRDEARPQRLPARERLRRRAARAGCCSSTARRTTGRCTSSSSTFCASRVSTRGWMNSVPTGGVGRGGVLGMHHRALLVAGHRLEPHLEHIALERRHRPTPRGSPCRAGPQPAGWSAR